jgi:hypothetical protein
MEAASINSSNSETLPLFIPIRCQRVLDHLNSLVCNGSFWGGRLYCKRIKIRIYSKPVYA